MSDQKVCTTCGTEYPLSERFCPRDGTALRSAAGQGDLLGTVVADRYHIIKKLGEGGMGAVYLAEHVKMGRKSALKVMHPGMNADPDAVARFNREAANASRLSHPNICGIYDFGETPDGLIYLAMEFIEGKALADLIEADGALKPARAGSIVHQTADALQLAHDAGIVHRDLKPDNIMVARNRDGSDLVKVVDFGIAKASSSEAQKVTKTGLVVGTPEYMSPEQLAGDKLDGRSDIYSLGLVAFNCLTGKLPFPSETAQEAMIMRLTDRPRTLAEMRPEVAWPEALQAVMDRALARDASERYQGAAQFGREFAAAVGEMPAVAATEGATMVMSASAATPASAKTAAMAAPPPTRVAGGAGRAQAPAAAAAKPATVAKKSPVLPVLGGLAAAAVIGYFGIQQFGGGSDTPAQPDSSSVIQLSGPAPDMPATNTGTAEQPGTPPATAQAPETSNPAPTKVATSTQTAAPANQTTRQPANSASGQTTRQPSNPPANTGGTTTPTQPDPAPATNTPSAPAVRDRLVSMQRELQRDGATEADATRILRETAPMRAGLTGTDLGEWHFAQMLAYTVLEDQDRMCPAARATAQAFPSGHPKGGFADNFWRQYCQ